MKQLRTGAISTQGLFAAGLSQHEIVIQTLGTSGGNQLRQLPTLKVTVPILIKTVICCEKNAWPGKIDS